jgi:uncharacterized membrane protein required for colicin V production
MIPLNWFDFVVLIVLGIGVYVGRSRGMSQELLDVLQWIAIVFCAGYLYQPLAEYAGLHLDFSLLWLSITAYLVLAILVKILFSTISKMAGKKLVGSDFFGRGEYYLGMIAGTVRLACILLAALALLNAKHISADERAAQVRMQKDNFGDIAFPTFSTLQHGIFRESLSGPLITTHLGPQLISPVAPDKKLVQRQSIGKMRENAVQEVIRR